MTRWISRVRWRPTKTTIFAGAIIALGILLTGVSWGFFFLVGLGMLGPGLLRELGWLKDQDEFQRQAARRAGYHAFLATGLLAFALVALLRTGEHGIKEPEPVVSLLLVVLWFTWVLSSLLAYWGPRRTARTLLVTFGIFWLLFSVADSLHSLPMLLMQSLIAVPFFALAYAAGRWPRVTGVVLVAAAAFFFYFFDLYRVFGPEPLSRGGGEVLVLFIGPLLASGIALLAGLRGEKDAARGNERQ